jgi:predicted metal-dependent hydrolase
MTSQLNVDGLHVKVVRKDIKHAYLRVNGVGEVRMTAPKRMSNRELVAFAHSKLGWIRRQQRKFKDRPQPTQHKYVSGERFQVWGQTVHLGVVEHKGRHSVGLKGAVLRLIVRPGTSKAKREALIQSWYREALEAAVKPLLARWEPALGVRVARVSFRTMKTRWGSCSTKQRTIRLNTELARLNPEYLEYVLVHELVHLLEPSHNGRYKGLMDKILPGWRSTRKALNTLSLWSEWPD